MNIGRIFIRVETASGFTAHAEKGKLSLQQSGNGDKLGLEKYLREYHVQETGTNLVIVSVYLI